jgi:hypothetical protein
MINENEDLGFLQETRGLSIITNFFELIFGCFCQFVGVEDHLILAG